MFHLQLTKTDFRTLQSVLLDCDRRHQATIEAWAIATDIPLPETYVTQVELTRHLLDLMASAWEANQCV